MSKSQTFQSAMKNYLLRLLDREIESLDLNEKNAINRANGGYPKEVNEQIAKECADARLVAIEYRKALKELKPKHLAGQ